MKQQYRDFAITLAKQAGAIMRQNFTLGMKREWKGDGTPLTATDTTINQLVLEAVKKEYPEHGVIAEEGNNYNEQAYVWVCDPIDGTIQFSHGLPNFTFCLALVRDGVSLLGVIYDPMLDRMMVAERGQGAFLNGQPAHVSKSTWTDRLLMTREGLRHTTKYDLDEVMRTLAARKITMLQLYGSGYGGMLVALGELDGLISTGHDPWDYAAVKVIVEEAGGKVTDLFGHDPRWDKPVQGTLASNGILHDEILSVLNLKA
ncbi:MAG: inositol monophosphatase [Candidatus Kerfeldbacteria bacterium]|nr:inositol monophosphatase [Candidatus Kerfeldbacteria bacterium]